MLIDLSGYAGDRRVSGHLVLDADRLTDMLNREDAIILRNAVLESLEDGRLVHLSSISLDRSELFAVAASGPRGPQARRVDTVRHRLQLQLGPFTVLGELHSPPGAPALASIGRRGPMLPLTAATIAYVSGGTLRMQDVTTLIVNRERADWIRASDAEALAFPGVPLLSMAVAS